MCKKEKSDQSDRNNEVRFDQYRSGWKLHHQLRNIRIQTEGGKIVNSSEDDLYVCRVPVYSFR